MSYVKNNYGCHCYYADSAFKRYNRAMGGDTVIFNYNSNNSYNCCGGHGGGFWSGLGMGLGMGVGNFLGGLCGNFFGGFGFGNMFGGFGFPSWGGFGNWGLGGSSSSSSSSGSNVKIVTVRENNKDTAKLAEYNKEIDALRKAIVSARQVSAQDKTKIDDLIKKIKASANAPIDGDATEKANDTLNYNALLNGLNDLKDGKITANINGQPVTIQITNEIKIGNTVINNIDDLDTVPDTTIKALDQNTAIQVLLKLGYIDFDSNSTRPDQADNTSTNRLVGKLSNHYNALLLLKKSGVAVEVENNPTAKVKDHWISGPITNVTLTSGVISYDVDCTKTGLAGYQAEYTITATDNTNTAFHATKKNGSVNVNSSIELTYQDEKKPLIGNGNPVATTN